MTYYLVPELQISCCFYNNHDQECSIIKNELSGLVEKKRREKALVSSSKDIKVPYRPLLSEVDEACK